MSMVRHYYNNAGVIPFAGTVMGIVLDGPIDGLNGATGRYVDANFNNINLAPDYFDTHPSWNFTDVETPSGESWVSIPIAYFKKGKTPSGHPYFLISPEPRDGFYPNTMAFTDYSGNLKDRFLIGKYYASMEGSTLVSRSPLNPMVNITPSGIISLTNATDSKGLTLTQFHDVLLRAIIEAKSTNPLPLAKRINREACIYRGIYDFFYLGGIINRVILMGSYYSLGLYTESSRGVLYNTGLVPSTDVWSSKATDLYCLNGRNAMSDTLMGSSHNVSGRVFSGSNGIIGGTYPALIGSGTLDSPNGLDDNANGVSVRYSVAPQSYSNDLGVRLSIT